MRCKHYPEGFKNEADKQVIERGHSVANVAKRLDITTHSLFASVMKFGPDSKRYNGLSEA